MIQKKRSKQDIIQNTLMSELQWQLNHDLHGALAQKLKHAEDFLKLYSLSIRLVRYFLKENITPVIVGGKDELRLYKLIQQEELPLINLIGKTNYLH